MLMVIYSAGVIGFEEDIIVLQGFVHTTPLYFKVVFAYFDRSSYASIRIFGMILRLVRAARTSAARVMNIRTSDFRSRDSSPWSQRSRCLLGRIRGRVIRHLSKRENWQARGNELWSLYFGQIIVTI